MDIAAVISSIPPWGWGAITILAVLAVNYRRQVIELARGMKGVIEDDEGSRDIEAEPDNAIADDTRWSVLDEIEGGSPYPVIAMDYEYIVKVINDEALDLIGYGFHAVINRPMARLLPHEGEDVMVGWLATYLRGYKSGDALKMQKVRRALTIMRADGHTVNCDTYWTHFGNGHGGFRIILVPEA